MKKHYQFFLLLLLVSMLVTSCVLSGCITTKQSIVYDGRTRTYILHLPPSYDDQEEFPLVVVLHGGGGNSENMMKKTGFNDLADIEDFIVVYPDGTGKFKNRVLTWNAGHCCGYALENNVDDVGFIKALIEKLQETLKIDPKKIYVTGHSNGGMMSYRIGAELSDIVAAIAPVAGTIGGKATAESEEWIIPNPTQPLSVVAVHGQLDQNVPYDGGHGEKTSGTRSDIAVNDSINFWVQHNHCNPYPELEENGNVSIKTYSTDDSIEVVLYTIKNGEHWWPGSDKDPYQEVSATNLIWEFFERHYKP